MRLESAEVDTVLTARCTVEIILAKAGLLNLVHSLHPYYLWALHYFSVHSNTRCYTAWTRSEVEGNELFGTKELKHLYVRTLLSRQVFSIQPFAGWVSVSGEVFSGLQKD